MALNTKVTIVDTRGDKHVVEGGIFSHVSVEQGANGVCITKEDVFGFKKETICVQQPRAQIDTVR